VKPAAPRGLIRGPDLKRSYLSLFLVEMTISLVGVVVSLASAIASGTRLQRRRKYEHEEADRRRDEDAFSTMVRFAAPICASCVFGILFLAAYNMMMPKYKRHIFLLSHLFCVISMLSLSVYAVIILKDILRFPHGSIGLLDLVLDGETGIL
ncbi:hypothetical protein PFISCL1PPCAC_5280, partial [Pristionchus fissidentatus]